MAKVGIMHSGSQGTDDDNVKAFQKSLELGYGGAVDYAGSPLYAKELGKHLTDLAKDLLAANVDILVAAGGSRSAEAARNERAKRNPPDKPIILFTSVARYICDNLAQNMTGVCANNSDYNVARLRLLIDMGFKGKRIGVLVNSDRGDHQKQIKELDDEVRGKEWKLRYRDIKIDKKLKELFDWLKGDIHALLVAADPSFNQSRKEAVEGITLAKYPAIFQWRQFVELGGLMSYGPNIAKLYQQAGTMAAGILNSGVIPAVWVPRESDFELVVNESTAGTLKLLPLPKPIADRHPEMIR